MAKATAAQVKALLVKQRAQLAGAQMQPSGSYLPRVSPVEPSSILRPKFVDTSDPLSPIRLNQPVVAPDVSSNAPLTGEENFTPGVNVTPTTRYATLSKTIGGGQFVTDPNDPNSIKKNVRDVNYQMKTLARGGLPGRLYQIDHIIPLEYGGSNAPENLRTTYYKVNEHKTKVQAVLRKLMDAGDIGKNEALTWVLNDDLPVDNIDLSKLDKWNNLPDGQAGLDLARNVFKTWRDGPGVTLKGYLQALKEGPSSIAKSSQEVIKAYPALAAMTPAVPLLAQMTPGSKADVLTGEGLQATAAGVTGGIGFKVGTHQYADQDTQRLVNYTRVAGDLVGNVLGTIAAVGVAGHVLTGGVALASRLTPNAIALARAAKVGEEALAAERELQAAKAAEQTATKLSKAAQTIKQSPYIQKILSTGARVGPDGITAASRSLNTFLQTAGGYALHGQLKEFDDEQAIGRMRRLTSDVIFGAGDSLGGHTLKATAAVMFGAFTASMVASGGNTQQGLKDALMVGTMHSLGSIGHQARFASMVEGQADAAVAAYRDQWLNYAPEGQVKFNSENMLANAPDRIAAEDEVIRKNISRAMSTGTINETEAKEALKRLVVTTKYKYKELLPQEAKLKQELVDMRSVRNSLDQKMATFGVDSSYPESIQKHMALNPDMWGESTIQRTVTPAEEKMISQKLAATKPETFWGGKDYQMQLTHTGDTVNIDATTRKNILDVAEAMKAGKTDSSLFLVRNEEMAPIIEMQNRTNPDIISGKKPPYVPEDHVVAYKLQDGELKYLGTVPTEYRIDGEGNATSLNENIRRRNRQNETSFPVLDKGMNNSDLAAKMRAHDIEVLHANIKDLGVATESGQPYVVVNVPKQKWSDSVRTNHGIHQITNEQVSSTAEALARLRMQQVKTPEEVMASLPKTPVEKKSFFDRFRKQNVPTQATQQKSADFADLAAQLGEHVKAKNGAGALQMINDQIGTGLTMNDLADVLHHPETMTFRRLTNLIDQVQERGQLNENGQQLVAKLQTLSTDPTFMKAMGDGVLDTPVAAIPGRTEVFHPKVESTATQVAKTYTAVENGLPTPATEPHIHPVEAPVAEKAAGKASKKAQELVKAGQMDMAKDLGIVREAPTARGVEGDIKTPTLEIMDEDQGTLDLTKQTLTTKSGVTLSKQPNADGSFWLEQNKSKPSKWAALAKDGHMVEHLMLPENKGYAGKVRIDGVEYPYNEVPTPEKLAEVRSLVSRDGSPPIKPPELGETITTPSGSPEAPVAPTSRALESINFGPKAGEEQAKNWASFNSKYNDGIDDIVTPKQREFFDAGNMEQVNKLQKFKEEFTRENMINGARNALAESDNDVGKAFDLYKKNIAKRLEDAGVNHQLMGPDADFATTQNLRNQFLKALYHKTSREAIIDSSGNLLIRDGEGTLISNADHQLKDFETKLNSKLEAEGKPKVNLDVIGISNKDSRYPKGVTTITDKMQYMQKKMLENDYLLTGVKGNGFEKAFAVKYDKNVADLYDPANPRYRFKGESENWLNELPKDGQFSPDHEKFFRVFLSDVLGIPPETTGADLAKRFNLLLNHELPVQVRGKVYKHFVLDPKQLKDLKSSETGTGVVDQAYLTGAKPSAVESKLDREAYDGKIFVSKDMADEWGLVNGFDRTNIKHFKPIAIHRTVENGVPKMFLMKGDIAVMDDFMKQRFEQILGKQLPIDNSVVTFGSNVKIGPKVPPGQTHYEIDVPSESYSIKNLSEPEGGNKVSLSFFSKFGHEPIIGEKVATLYNRAGAQWKDFLGKINEAKTADDFQKVFTEYKDIYGTDPENFLYGPYRTVFAAGGGRRALGERHISEMLNKTFREKVLGLKTIVKSGHFYATPDFGFWDPAQGQFRYLNDKELMVSQSTANKMNLNEGDEVFTVRYPISRKTAISPQKVLIGENYHLKNADSPKISYLGDEQVVTNFHDTYIRKEGDFDGDTLFLFKKGGSDGLPDEIASHIEAQRAKDGDIILPELAKYKPMPPTLGNMSKIMEGQLLGNEAIGITAANQRILEQLVSNDLKMRITSATKNGERKFQFIVGNKIIKSGPMAPMRGSNFGHGNVELSFKNDPKTMQMLTEIMQESVDSVKSPALADRGWTKNYNVDRTITGRGRGVEKLFTKGKDGFDALNDPAVTRQIGDMLMTYQLPYRGIGDVPSKVSTKGFETNVELNGAIAKYKDLMDNVVAGGGKLTPVQKAMYEFTGMTPFSVTPEEIVNADARAGSLLKDDFAAQLKQTPNAPVRELMSKAAQIKKRYNTAGFDGYVITQEAANSAKSDNQQALLKLVGKKFNRKSDFDKALIDAGGNPTPEVRRSVATEKPAAITSTEKKNIRQEFLDYYEKNRNAGIYNKEDTRRIALWAATEDMSNLFQANPGKLPSRLYRYNELIAEDADVLKTYLKYLEQ